MFVKNNYMEKLDKIVDDYLSDCFHNDNVKPYATENIEAWWKLNRRKYDSEIAEIIRNEVEHRLMRMIFEGESKNDIPKN